MWFNKYRHISTFQSRQYTTTQTRHEPVKCRLLSNWSEEQLMINIWNRSLGFSYITCANELQAIYNIYRILLCINDWIWCSIIKIATKKCFQWTHYLGGFNSMCINTAHYSVRKQHSMLDMNIWEIHFHFPLKNWIRIDQCRQHIHSF